MGPLNIDFWGLGGNPRAWAFFGHSPEFPKLIKWKLTLLKRKVIKYQKLEIWELIFFKYLHDYRNWLFSLLPDTQKEQGKIHGSRVQPLTAGKASRGSMRRLFVSHPQSGSRETDECWSSAHSPRLYSLRSYSKNQSHKNLRWVLTLEAHPLIPPETCLLGDLT